MSFFHGIAENINKYFCLKLIYPLLEETTYHTIVKGQNIKPNKVLQIIVSATEQREISTCYIYLWLQSKHSRLNTFKLQPQPCLVAQAYSPSNWKAEAGGLLWAWGQSEYKIANLDYGVRNSA